MRVLLYLTLALLVGASSAHGAKTDFMQGLGDTRYHELDSAIVERAFHIFVRLPENYDEEAAHKYPTIYLLDGGVLYPLLSAYYRYLNLGEEVPDAVIVGISYGSANFETGNYRSTDYTAPSPERAHWGGAETFQRVLSEELFPLIEGTYRSRSDRRVILGQSIGGQFVLYTALTKPDLFWGHIASNPALHRNLPFFLEAHGAPASGSVRSKLFVGSGSLDDARFREPALEWIESWTGRESTPWDLETMDLQGHTHFSAAPAAFRQGMTWLFSDQ